MTEMISLFAVMYRIRKDLFNTVVYHSRGVKDVFK